MVPLMSVVTRRSEKGILLSLEEIASMWEVLIRIAD